MYKKPIFIASDHAGYELKTKLVQYLEDEYEMNITDLGPNQYAKDDDYPDYVVPLAEEVVETDGMGILICGNGVGVCMAANKMNGVRAGIGYSDWAAKTMREDDNTNVICLPARALGEDEAKYITKTWLEAEFSNAERHKRRLKKVKELEQ